MQKPKGGIVSLERSTSLAVSRASAFDFSPSKFIEPYVQNALKTAAFGDGVSFLDLIAKPTNVRRHYPLLHRRSEAAPATSIARILAARINTRRFVCYFSPRIACLSSTSGESAARC